MNKFQNLNLNKLLLSSLNLQQLINNSNQASLIRFPQEYLKKMYAILKTWQTTTACLI